MKIITCASYYGCGSSAVTDLISEYEDVKSLTNYEFRFIHDLDGISDLEYHLVDCPNRHNTGHALKRFIKLMKFNAGRLFCQRYEPFFQNQYWKLTKEYINRITTFEYKGFWFYDMYDRGVNIYYWYSLLTKLYARLPLKIFEPLPKEVQYGTILNKKDFIRYTQEYIHQLLSVANSENFPFLMVDQILPSSNVERCLKYFSDSIYMFIVDRDPRDLYISCKKIWTKDHVAPVESPTLFCQWYRFTRECAHKETYDTSRVLKLQFEDMIYKYEESKEKIVALVGLDEAKHTKPFLAFNPKRSVVNTQLWKVYPELEKEIEVIKRMLPEYLYDFESVKGMRIMGIEPEIHKVF